jgi:hypothetical protein
LQETYEFRIFSEYSKKYSLDQYAEDLGAAKRIKTARDTLLFDKIKRATLIEEKNGNPLFAGWHITRTYSEEELRKAELFRFWQDGAVPLLEAKKTQSYDESIACPYCLSGAQQIGPLEISFPRNFRSDFSRLPSGQVIVSRLFSNLLRKESVSGIELVDLRAQRPKKSATVIAPRLSYRQMKISEHSAELVAPSLFGDFPFRDSIKSYLCGLDHILGLNVLSEVHIRKSSIGGHDVTSSSKFVGAKRGAFMPNRLLFCTPKFRQIVLQNDIRGINFEIAYFS